MEGNKRRNAKSAKRAEISTPETKHSSRMSSTHGKGVKNNPSRSSQGPETQLAGNAVVEKSVSANKKKKFLEDVSAKGEVVSMSGRRRWPFQVAGVACAIAAAFILCVIYTPHQYNKFPCQCSALPGPLATALSGKRFGLTGFHVQQLNPNAVNEELTALSACAKVHRLRTPFNGVEALSQRLQKDALSGKCHVWVAESVAVLHSTANALKELFEDNALRGEKILPEDARGIFLVLSPKGRGHLKEVLPHRVVHMLHTIAV